MAQEKDQDQAAKETDDLGGRTSGTETEKVEKSDEQKDRETDDLGIRAPQVDTVEKKK